MCYSQNEKNGNVITHYINEEDGKEKTIIWVKGITPPRMGGEQSDFKKEITKVPNSSIEYIDYHAPYVSGHGWYDVNKSNTRASDANLCFAAAASNTLHWWLDQNTEYISKYLKENPDAPKAKEIEELRHSFKNQMESDIFQIFVRQFGNRIEGYWPDILIDQFINGYYPKADGGTNDPSFSDGDKLISQGPDPRGGFFYPVFGIQNLTERQYYFQGYEEISKNLKKHILNGDMALMTIMQSAQSHVVTLWGVEYDMNGKISAVYYSDSDDQRSIGMSRYRIINSNGVALATTSNSVSGGSVQAMNYISLGKNIWEKKLHITKKELNLVWENTNFTYTGELQGPTVKATNIDKGDDVILEVEGQQREAGNHTATVLLKGASAQYYKLPENHIKEFTIQKAKPEVNLKAEVQENESVKLEATVSGVNLDAPNGNVQFIDCISGKTIGEGKLISSTEGKGVATYSWSKMEKRLYHLKAIYQGNNNYTGSSSEEIELDFSKKPQVNFQIGQIEPKRYGDSPFKLSTTGGNGNGAVTYKSSDSTILSISGDLATIHKTGSVIISATKEEDDNYQSASTSLEITILKGVAPAIIYPTASSLTYGEKLADSNLNGGSVKYGTFQWEDDSIVPLVNNQGYPVVFIPNEHTIENYEPIMTTIQNVTVSVNKATPQLILNSKVDPDSRSVLLSTSVANSGNGDYATGFIKFIDCISGNELTSDEIALENGQATYLWKNVPSNEYQIKAVYYGDSNYNAAESTQIRIDMQKKPQDKFDINPVGLKTYGDGPFVLYTQGGSGTGLVSYESSNSDILSISQNTATIHKAGIVTIKAIKAEDDDYNETQASVVVKIEKRPLTITANDQLDIVQGSPFPNLTYKIEGLIDGDSVVTNPVLEANVDSTNEVGAYDIIISGGNFTNQESYQIVYVNGKLTIIEKKEEENNPEPPVEKPPVENPEVESSPVEKPSKLDSLKPNTNINGTGTANDVDAPISFRSETTASNNFVTKNFSKEASKVTEKDTTNKDTLKKNTYKKKINSSESKDKVINPPNDHLKEDKTQSSNTVKTVVGVTSVAAIGGVATKCVLIRKRKRKFKR